MKKITTKPSNKLNLQKTAIVLLTAADMHHIVGGGLATPRGDQSTRPQCDTFPTGVFANPSPAA
ncbi:MAG TPA: class I lanthipeptide [Chitinophaga sp.]|uniref:class I lanthipeptide n=1 Tax=Chitinophaga sp. TaxID=1869181 RepID=UPI002BA682EE|nr:class I lanthipeptide [Chitinophaga sp.]HVI45998.1 class I lanthipeptide [Chitinophaga sp.]